MTKSMKGRPFYWWPVILLVSILACKKDLGPDEPTTPVTTEVDTKVSMNNVVGVDQFGRSFSTISGTNDKKQVGLFFWLWIGQPYAAVSMMPQKYWACQMG